MSATRLLDNRRAPDEVSNSVRGDIVQNDTHFDEVIHRFTKVSLEVVLKTGKARSTSPGGPNMLDMSSTTSPPRSTVA